MMRGNEKQVNDGMNSTLSLHESKNDNMNHNANVTDSLSTISMDVTDRENINKVNPDLLRNQYSLILPECNHFSSQLGTQNSLNHLGNQTNMNHFREPKLFM